MRFDTIITTIGLIGTTLTAPLQAAEEEKALSLPQLLEEARQSNPDLLAARKRWEAAKAKIPLATGLPAPTIGVEWEEIPRGTIKVNQATLMYQLIQSIPFPGKLSAKHRVAVAEAQVAAMGFKQAENDVLSQLKSVYYDIYLLDRRLELQQAQQLWAEQLASSARTNYATGKATYTDMVRAQAEAASAATMIETLHHRREAMAAHLNHLVNHPIGHAPASPGPIVLTPLPFSPEELRLIAQERQPELLMFKYAAERADASLKLAKRELLPDLQTMVELRDPAMGPLGPWDLSLALVLPFWFWTKLRYGVRVAMYDKESAQAASQAMHNEIARRIHEQWHEAAAAYAQAKTAESLIPLSQQAVASSLAAYQAGRGSLAEALEALRLLAEQQRTYDEQLVQFEQHVVMLEQASGGELR